MKDKSQTGDIYNHLRIIIKYRKRYGCQNRKEVLLNRDSIKIKRSAEMDQRLRSGDLENDTIIGVHHQGILFSMVERKSRFGLLHGWRKNLLKRQIAPQSN